MYIKKQIYFFIPFLLIAVMEIAAAGEPGEMIRIFTNDKISPQQRISPSIRLIRINKASLLSMGTGQEAILEIADGKTQIIVYDSVDYSQSGSRTWIGHYRDYGKDYRVMITMGARGGVFGFINDPSGTYQIESYDNQERLVSLDNADMKPAPKLVDDAIPPPAVPEHKLDINSEVQALGLSTAPIPTVDLLVIYTPGMVSRYGSYLLAKIDSFVSISNQAYKDSGVAMRLRLVGAREVSYGDSTDNYQALQELSGTNSAIPAALADVKVWRNSLGADMVSMLRPFIYPVQQSCGVAWIGGYGSANTLNGWSDYGYSVVSVGTSGSYYCQDITLTHELGHNMGNMHDHRTMGANSATGVFNYSFGFGLDNYFSTIMAYSSSFSNAPTLNKFSNTNQDITCNNKPCGVPGEDPITAADNARSMNNIRSQLAAWRATTIPIFPDVPIGGVYYSYVEAIFNSEITKGCGEGLYCPSNYVSREQMAAFIVRAVQGEPVGGCYTAPFSDVSVSNPLCVYIKALVELNVTKGCGVGVYCPTDYVTREQMAAFLIRAIEGEPPTGYCGSVAPFSDVSETNTYCPYIKRLVELNVTKGCAPNKYCPFDLVSREQMAAFLARAFLNMN